MKNKVIKIAIAIIIVALIIGNIFSFTQLKERDRIIDKLEDEIKDQKKEIKTSKSDIDELEYQVDYYEEMYGKYNFDDEKDEDNNTSSSQNENANQNTNKNQITYEQYQKMLNNKESFVLVISQTYCSHCIEYKPHFFNVINSNKILGYDLDLLTLTDEEYNKILDSLKIGGTPTTLFYRDGVEIPDSRLEGNKSEEELTKALKKYGFM